MPTTTNFGWTTPADTDLVKDGAAAIRTLGNGIDASLLDLKGGTTGQILSKATNTDLDFTWVTNGGIQSTIVDAKGDIIAATAADTVSRLAVGANDTVLTADSSTATGLKWATPASGGMTLLTSGSLTGSSVTTASLSQSYINLFVILRAFNVTTDASAVLMRCNGVTASNSYIDFQSSGSGALTYNSTSMTLVGNIHHNVAANMAIIQIPDYTNTSTMKQFLINTIAKDTSAPSTSAATARFMSGFAVSTSAISTLTFFPSTGSWDGGDYLVYGVK